MITWSNRLNNLNFMKYFKSLNNIVLVLFYTCNYIIIINPKLNEKYKFYRSNLILEVQKSLLKLEHFSIVKSVLRHKNNIKVHIVVKSIYNTSLTVKILYIRQFIYFLQDPLQSYLTIN
jgi:hypothetical protein